MTQKTIRKTKQFFSLMLVLVMMIGIITPGSATVVKAEDTYQTKLAAATKCLNDNVDPVYSGEWALIEQARGNNPDKKWLHKYYDSLIKQLDDENEVANMKPNDWIRVLLALEALGVDPANVNGKNLFSNVADFTAIDYGSVYAVTNIALLSLAIGDRDDSIFANENVNDNDRTTKKKLKESLLSYYDVDNKCYGGPDWYTHEWKVDPDTAAAAVYGLSMYYKKDDAVTSVIDNTLTTLGNKVVDENGCVVSYGAASPCSTAQVICALTSIGVNPTKDARFVKNGKTLIDGLCTFFDPKTGGVNANDYYTGEEYLDLALNTVQSAYALVAYDRLINGKTFVFDNSDVKAPIYHYGGKATCVSKAKCEGCGQEYGEIDANNHTGRFEYKNIKEATYDQKGYTGDKVCLDCGVIIEKGKETGTIKSQTSDYNVTKSSDGTFSAEYKSSLEDKSATVTIQNTIRDNYGNEYKVTKVSDDAFSGNNNLKTVTLGIHVTEIGANAFKNCSKLTKIITQNENLSKIDAGAFSGAKSLTSVDFSECNLETIDKDAFSGCKKLNSFKVNGNKLKSIGANAFKGIKKNAKITIAAKNKKQYNKVVKMFKKAGAKKAKYKFVKKK